MSGLMKKLSRDNDVGRRLTRTAKVVASSDAGVGSFRKLPKELQVGLRVGEVAEKE
jgi:hypothetical protein